MGTKLDTTRMHGVHICRVVLTFQINDLCSDWHYRKNSIKNCQIEMNERNQRKKNG